MRHLIILATKNREGYVLKLLDSIYNNKFDLDLIVIDSTEPSIRFNLFDLELKKLYGDKNLIHVYHKGRLPSARNKGLEFIKNHNYIHFFDDDVILPSDYFENIVSFMNNNPEISGGGPLVSGYQPLIKKLSAKKIPSIIQKLINKHIEINFGRVTPGISNIWVPEDSRRATKYVEWIPGCAMFFKKVVFENFSFNQNLENLFGGYALGEDLEFTYRVSRSYKLGLVSELKVIHDHAPSPRDDFEFINKCSGALAAHMHCLYPNYFKKRQIFLIKIIRLLALYFNRNGPPFKKILEYFKEFNLQFKNEIIYRKFKQ